ncbi:hypothetical protein CPT32_12990 [Rhizobium sophoriradicis]|uniref:hypothetical protein n=1 Tax=Rhizobium sophoriradicis TaxID=1535245 RepID=UPI000BBD707E|nr:hypothetical protein [Rhizobium sophoriradicis]PCK86331.1 hypothetical protein CPT32_12990 [Rhizobium sophoriradicis]
MYLQYLTLDDDDIDLVTNAVRDWCRTHCVPLESESGREAMRFAVGHVASGVRSTVALSKAMKTLDPFEEF